MLPTNNDQIGEHGLISAGWLLSVGAGRHLTKRSKVVILKQYPVPATGCIYKFY
jgi:hypothetical protein